MAEQGTGEIIEYISVMANLTKQEEMIISSFEERFNSIYEHKKRVANVTHLANTLLKNRRFDVKVRDELVKETIELKRFIFQKFDLLVREERALMERNKELISKEENYVKRGQSLFARDYIQLHRDLVEGGIKGSNAKDVLEKEIEEIKEYIRKEKKRIDINRYLQETIERSVIIIKDIKGLVIEEIALLDKFIFRETYIENRQEFDDNLVKLSKMVKKLEKLLRNEKETVITPFNKFLEEKRSIDSELKKNIEARGKITINMIKDDLRRLTTRPKEVSYYIHKLKDNYEYLDSEAKDYIRRYVNRLRSVAEWKRDKEEATIDELTQLKAEKAFISDIEDNEIPRAIRTNSKFSIAMIDIDHFKKFNDTYGHKTGDLVLSFLAKTMQNTVRTTDTPYRLHGEEFVVLYIDTDKEQARQAAEKLRRAVETGSARFMEEINKTVRLPLFKKGKKNITISIGIATYPDDGIDRSTLYAKADKALYNSKETGRNRVTASGEERKKGVTTILRQIIQK